MKQAAKPAHHAPRKPWKEAHQQVLTVGVFVALVATVIVGIGWKDGYWSSKPQTAVNTSLRGPR